MDDDRRIRFLVAPILFVASILLGVCLDQRWRDPLIKLISQPTDGAWPKLIGLVAGGGLTVFVAGYVIGTLTYFFLRVIFWIRPLRWGRSRFHEVALTDAALQNIWQVLDASGRPDRSRELFAGVIFDHDVLKRNHEGVHLWIVRRWNAFSIAATSFCGLILSTALGAIVGISASFAWLFPIIAFSAVLIFVMTWAWRDTMNMLSFIAALPLARDEFKRPPDPNPLNPN